MEPVVVISTLAAFLVYCNTLTADFAYDDGRAIQTNPDVKPGSPIWNLLGHDFWGTPLTHSGSHKSYRPVTVLTFRLNYWLGTAWETSTFATGGDAAARGDDGDLFDGGDGFEGTWDQERAEGRGSEDGNPKHSRKRQRLPAKLHQHTHQQQQPPSAATFHLVNVILHAVATGLYSTLCCRLLRSSATAADPAAAASKDEPTSSGGIGRREAASVASLAFAVHPIHTEAVAGIVGRADVVACIFFLLSLGSYLDYLAARDAGLRRRCGASPSPTPSGSRRCSNSGAAATAAAAATTLGSGNVNVNNNRHRHRRRHQSCDSCCSPPSTATATQPGNEVVSSSSSCDHQIAAGAAEVERDLFELPRGKDKARRMTPSPSATPPRSRSPPLSLSAAAVGSYRRRRCWHLGLCVIFAVLSMLSKEHGLTVLGVCAVYDLFVVTRLKPRDVFDAIFTRRRHLTGVLLEGVVVLAVTTVLCLALRLYVMGAKPPEFSPADNPAADSSSLLARTLTFLHLPVFNFWLLVCPAVLSFDWSMDAVPLVTSAADVRNLASVLFYACLALACRRSFRRYRHSAHQLNNQHGGGGGGSFKSRAPPSSWTSTRIRHRRPSRESVALADASDPPPPPTSNGAVAVGRRHERSSASASPPRVTASAGSEEDRDLICARQRGRRRCGEAEAEGDAVDDGDLATLGLALLAIPFLPATNAFFYVGFVVAERVLYVPSMGYCLLLGLGASRVADAARRRRRRRPAAATSRWSASSSPSSSSSSSSGLTTTRDRRRSGAGRFLNFGDWICGSGLSVKMACGILLVIFSLRTLRRNEDWSTEEKLYRAGIPVNPPKAYGNVANILSAKGMKDEAEKAYKMALSFRSNMADVHYNMGILFQEQKRYEEALQAYTRAIQFRPRMAMAHLNMGLVLGILGRREEATEIYRKCAQLDVSGLKDPRTHEATKTSALFNLGRLLADDDRVEEAIEAYLEAVHKMPSHYQPQSLYNMLGEAYFKLGDWAEAEKWYLNALKAKVDHVPAHLTYGKLLAKSNRLHEAEEIFKRAKFLAPEDSTVYQHYGQFLAESERHEEAAENYIRAASLASEDYEIVFNAANTLRQAGRNKEAEKFYRKAVLIRPEEATSHMNLGAMLHVNGKLVEAEASYLEALRLKPEDKITQANLQKLRQLLAKVNARLPTSSNSGKNKRR